MARPGGRLHLLTIAAIFVVVFAGMWSAIQYSRGELVPEQNIDDGEQRLRSALWDAIDAWRAERGYLESTRARRVSNAAQRTALAFAAGNLSAGTVNATERGHASSQPSARAQCSQLLVRPNVSSLPVRSETPDERVASTARAVLSTLVRKDAANLLHRRGAFVNGIGVVADDGALFVVYRSCSQRRLSP